jgi:hypothetical protein
MKYLLIIGLRNGPLLMLFSAEWYQDYEFRRTWRKTELSL